MNITIEKPGTFGANRCNSTHCRKSVVHFYCSHPCTTIRHTEKVLLLAVFCYGTKTKRPRIFLIYRVVCFNLRNIAQQKRPFEKDLTSGKRDSNSRPQPWQGCALPTELFPRKPGKKKRFGIANIRAKNQKPKFSAKKIAGPRPGRQLIIGEAEPTAPRNPRRHASGSAAWRSSRSRASRARP